MRKKNIIIFGIGTLFSIIEGSILIKKEKRPRVLSREDFKKQNINTRVLFLESFNNRYDHPKVLEKIRKKVK